MKGAGKRKPGRPRKDDAVRRRSMIGFRASLDLRNKLDAAVSLNGRSLSQETEIRVERSFRDDELMSELRVIRAMLTEGR